MKLSSGGVLLFYLNVWLNPAVCLSIHCFWSQCCSHQEHVLSCQSTKWQRERIGKSLTQKFIWTLKKQLISANQSVCSSICLSVHPCIYPSINWSVSQSASQSVTYSVSQPSKQTGRQSVSKANAQRSQSVSQKGVCFFKMSNKCRLINLCTYASVP